MDTEELPNVNVDDKEIDSMKDFLTPGFDHRSKWWRQPNNQQATTEKGSCKRARKALAV